MKAKQMVWRVMYRNGGRWTCANQVALVYEDRAGADAEAELSTRDGYGPCRVNLVSRAVAKRQALARGAEWCE